MMEVSEDSLNGLFEDPDGYYQAEKPATHEHHIMKSGEKIDLKLVGHNPLWGHMLWNAGRTVANYLEDNASLIDGKSVLEFGAGAGLPSIVCALSGAAKVVVTDYPDPELIDNIRYNIQNCSAHIGRSKIIAQGFVWGSDVTPLKAHLSNEACEGFDVLILADLLFNHSEHQKLVNSILGTLAHEKCSCALVFFTPYRPWLLDKDMDFFRVAESNGLASVKIFEHVMDNVLFESDPGDEMLRRTVYGYRLNWNKYGSRQKIFPSRQHSNVCPTCLEA